MPFVKLDCGILDSSLWGDRDTRDVFITALLMAVPHELEEPVVAVTVQGLKPTSFKVPPGWYGMVHASGSGIVDRAGLNRAQGLRALVMLGNVDADSRSAAFGGRRMVRVDGGFLILNYFGYRDRDYGGAQRQERWRQRTAARRQASEFSEAWKVIEAFYFGLCAYCGKRAWTDIDHVVPAALHVPANVVPACGRCVSAKRRGKPIEPLRRHPYMESDGSQTRYVTQAEAEAEAENVLTTETNLRPAAATWNALACEAFIARYGGTAPGARITKALRPLVTKHGAEPVLAAWTLYLSETEAEYVSAERFAATYGHWNGTERPRQQRGALPKAAARQQGFEAMIRGGHKRDPGKLGSGDGAPPGLPPGPRQHGRGADDKG